MSSHLLSLEASVLGAVLIHPDALGEFPRLEVDDFSDLRHRLVFTAMRNLEAAGRPIDVVTVEAEIAVRGAGAHVDYSFLGTLALNVPTVSNAHEYVRQIREAALTRKVRRELAEIVAHGERYELAGSELLSMAISKLSGIDEGQPDDATLISALVQKRLKQLEQIAAEKAAGRFTMSGFPSGVEDLDAKIGGLQPGIVTIVAARPGMGKSSFGLATADSASKAGIGVHLFSLEDTEDAYADRTMSRASGVPAEQLRNADINRGNAQDLMIGVHSLKDRRWLVDGRSGITAEEIVRSVRRHRRQNGTRVVIVDYIQLVKASLNAVRLSRHEQLSGTITTLADAAKLDRMAYVVMSQLNRDIEKRVDKRPQLADLRESGSLEERAKCVIGLYRGAVYGEPVKGIDYDDGWHGHSYKPDEQEHESQVQLHVLKNNNGRTGCAWATWNGPTTRMT